MTPGINSAISGLNAASKRIGVSAENIANQFSTSSIVDGESSDTPYRPLQVVQSTAEDGSVRTDLRPTDPATRPLYDPENPAADADGVVQYPNVDLEREIVNQQIATYDYKANLQSLKASNKTLQSLLDIFT